MKIDSVCVLGGTGFVGRHLVTRLNNEGKHVRVLTRRRERHRDLLVLPYVEIVEANIHDPDELRHQFADRDAVINLVGILNEKGYRGEGFRHAHVDLTRKVLAACKEQGVRRLLQMSALGADPENGPSHYLRTKGEAENHLHTFAEPQVAVTSFRPSVIFGQDDSFFNRFAMLLALAPVFPLACPQARFAPVYVGDVAARFAAALEDRASFGERYNLCGPEVWTLTEVVHYIRELRGYRRWIMPLPDWASRLQATALQFAPGKPFSRDNYNSLQIDSVCPEGGTCPTAVDAVMSDYLAHRDHQAELQGFRREARRRRRTAPRVR